MPAEAIAHERGAIRLDTELHQPTGCFEEAAGPYGKVALRYRLGRARLTKGFAGKDIARLGLVPTANAHPALYKKAELHILVVDRTQCYCSLIKCVS